MLVEAALDPFSPGIKKSTKIPRNLSPKRECTSKQVKGAPEKGVSGQKNTCMCPGLGRVSAEAARKAPSEERLSVSV